MDKKIDPELARLISRRVDEREAAVAAGSDPDVHSADRPIFVQVGFTGNVEDLRSAGFPLKSPVGGVSTAQLSVSQIVALAEQGGVRFIRATSTPRPTLDVSIGHMWTLAAWASGAGGATGKGAGAIVGVIDSGLDITHPAFLRADGTTRILRLWDQTFMYANGVPVTRTGDPFAPESIPRDENGGMALQARAPSAVDPDFDYGIQFNSDQINTALDRWRSGTAPPGSLQDENGHGTHVTGIAAGNGRARDTGNGVYVGVAPEADIIFVKTGISGRSGPDVSDIGQAARYIAGAAAAAAPGKPCVINISLGIHDTPHNGHDPEIRAIAELLGANDKVAVVIAASNERDDNLHATLSVTPGSRQTLNHRLRRDRRTLRFFVSYNAGATVKVAVRAPDGASTGELRVDGQERGFAGDHTVEVTKYEQLDGDPDRHFTILIDCDSRASIRLGLWDFTFIAEGGIRANIHMWRSSAQERKWGEFEPGPTPGTTAAQDAKRKDEIGSRRRPEDWIRATISSYAACAPAITVAAFDPNTPKDELARFSSQGPAPNNLSVGLYDEATSLPKPDIAGPGEWIDAPMSGVGEKDGCSVKSYSVKSGTSMAAPHVAGAVALMWSQRPTLSNVRIKALLLEGARSPIDPRLEDWDDTNANITAELFGSGRVSAEAAVIKALDEP